MRGRRRTVSNINKNESVTIKNVGVIKNNLTKGGGLYQCPDVVLGIKERSVSYQVPLLIVEQLTKSARMKATVKTVLYLKRGKKAQITGTNNITRRKFNYGIKNIYR